MSPPAPLVPADVDLRDFQYMELDVRRLRDSRFAAQVSGDAFRAGFLLWCASWHQVPAASLPDDDIELANLAGYGRFVKEWKKVKQEALYGFVMCSDGRWYHPVVVEKALSAWSAKVDHAYKKYAERMRKQNAARSKEGLDALPIMQIEAWKDERNSAALPAENQSIPPERQTKANGIPPPDAQHSAGIPADFLLEGTEQNRTEQNREGTERENKTYNPVAPGIETPTPTATGKPVREKSTSTPDTGPAWIAYSDAYLERYGSPPLRNAVVNTQMASFCKRVPLAEAPGIAAFFVGHNRRFYVEAGHPVKLLLLDAEKLRTEWVTNRQTTATQAMQTDRTQTNFNAFAPMIAEAREKEAREKELTHAQPKAA